MCPTRDTSDHTHLQMVEDKAKDDASGDLPMHHLGSCSSYILILFCSESLCSKRLSMFF